MMETPAIHPPSSSVGATVGDGSGNDSQLNFTTSHGRGDSSQNTNPSPVPSQDVGCAPDRKRPRVGRRNGESNKRPRSNATHPRTCGACGSGNGNREIDHEDVGNGNRNDHRKGDSSESHKGRNADVELPTERFACLLQKYDPWRFRSCEHFVLTAPDRVLQHLKRNHVLKGDNCPTCRIQFTGEHAQQQRIDHFRNAPPCKQMSVEETGFLLPEEYEKLKGLGAGICNEDKWCKYWRKLLPHVQLPHSPYFESHVDTLRREAPQMMEDILQFWLQTRGVEVSDDDLASLVHSLVGKVFGFSAIASPLPAGPSRLPAPSPAPAPAASNTWSPGQPPQISPSVPVFGPRMALYPDPVPEAPLSTSMPAGLGAPLETPDILQNWSISPYIHGQQFASGFFGLNGDETTWDPECPDFASWRGV